MKRTFLNVIVTLICSAIVACILLPPIWWLFHAVWGDEFIYSPGLVFKRIWTASTVLGLILARKRIGMQHPARAGFDTKAESVRNLVVGVLVAWFFLSVLAAAYYGANVLQPHSRYSFDRLLVKFYAGLLRGISVAFLEEYIFRGLIFLSFCRRYSWKTAATFSSLIFSMLHFLDSRHFHWMSHAIGWLSGFKICGTMLWYMFAQFTLIPDALGLFLIGWILCYALHRTGSIWYGIGLHGGWVWYAGMQAGLFEIVNLNNTFYFGGSSRLFDGIVPMIGLLVIFPITVGLIKIDVLYCKPKPEADRLE